MLDNDLVDEDDPLHRPRGITGHPEGGDDPALAAHRPPAVRNGHADPEDDDVRWRATCSSFGVAERMRRRQKWVRTVTTDSTKPPAGLFTKDAATIARTLASKKVSPKGPASGMRMLTYFINRGGRGLSKTRRAELERAKRLLSARVKRARERRNASATGDSTRRRS